MKKLMKKVLGAWCMVLGALAAGVATAAGLPTATRVFVLTVPAVENATVSVTTNGVPLVASADGRFLVLPNAEVSVDYSTRDGWVLVGTTHFEATVTGDLRLPAEGKEPTVLRAFTYMAPETNEVGEIAFVERATGAVIVTETTGTLGAGWYVVTDEVSCSGIDVATNCTANLILADGASLTVTGATNCAGIDVSPGKTLNIFGQRGGTGRLAATGGQYGAGIGGGDYGSGGTVTINGGEVTATGGQHGAGIGGGHYGVGGTVTVNGGSVTVMGGLFGAGIGGGYNGAGGTVTINGGVVTATGGDYGAGIGGGHKGAGGTVTLDQTKVEIVDGAVGNGSQYVRIEEMVIVAEVETFGLGWYVTAPYGAFVNTLFQPDSNTRVEMDVLVGDTSKREYWFGCWDVNWNDRAFALGNDSNNEVYCGYGSDTAHCGGIKGIIPSGRVTVALEKGVVYTNGTVWSAAHADSNTVFSLNQKLYLFAQNRAGFMKPGDGQERIVCYSCRIWTNGVDGASIPVRNFVPARTKDTRQIVGLYDTVSGEFYVPHGGTLTLGHDESAGPSCEGGEITEGEGGEWIVTPNTGVTEVTIGGLPDGAKLAVKCGEYAVPSAAFVGFGEGQTEGVFSLALDPEGVVTIGDEEIPVKPTIGDLDDGEPFALGDGSAAVTVRAIPGLKYSLVRGIELGAITTTVVGPTLATEAQMTLTDTEPLKDKAFYKVVVTSGVTAESGIER